MQLPIHQKLTEIVQAIQHNSVVIVAGETGSGKSTQLPQICMDLFKHHKGFIGHTQPRRIAARSVAARISEELKSPLGQQVGFKVRFNDRVSSHTHIKVMTDGILLAEIEHDPLLKKYKVLIIDEAHERSLNIDFLLGFLKKLLPKRPDLKIIITSATLDHERFSRYFENAPLIEVSGRTYPVELRYQALFDDDTQKSISQNEGVFSAVQCLLREKTGDILIFFATEREIRDCQHFLEKQISTQCDGLNDPSELYSESWVRDTIEILPLFGRLSSGAQDNIFHPNASRRIILSTNVAETSVTVPRIRYVIDTGKVRISRYSYKSKVQRLPIEPISQASANQRSGRCGRVAPGICIRLYSEEDFLSRPEYTDPEILRTNLAAVILKMVSLNVGCIEEFPFIHSPDAKYIKDGYRLLHEIGAMSKSQQMKPLGRIISQFPVDPRLAKMLCVAEKKKVLREVLVIVSSLSIADVRERPEDNQAAADAAHQKFWYGQSDFLAVLKLWDCCFSGANGTVKKSSFQLSNDTGKLLSHQQLRAFCKQHYLSFMRMREWFDLYQQMIQNVTHLKWSILPFEREKPYAKDCIHQAILSGLLSHIGHLDDNKTYRGARHKILHIFPGSSVFSKPPKWVMAYEVVETHKTYLRCVAKIDPKWLEFLAKHLIKRQYSEPYIRAVNVGFEGRDGINSEPDISEMKCRISAKMTLTLYGLTICKDRSVNFGPINPAASREVLIREGIVRRVMVSECPFLLKNRMIEDEVLILESKARRRDVMIHEDRLIEFYENIIPKSVFDGPSFKKWWLSLVEVPESFWVTKDLLTDIAVSNIDDFPDHWRYDMLKFPLSYHFDPASQEDGVTVKVPQVVLKQVPDHAFEWLVPGMLEEKITALIRSLPKSLRRQFVPVPVVASHCVVALSSLDHKHSLLTSLAEMLNTLGSLSISAEDFNLHSLEQHLLMRIQLLDSKGDTIAVRREIESLKRAHAKDLDVTGENFEDTWSDTGLRHWAFEEIPEKIVMNHQGIEIPLFPAVKDQLSCVDLILCDTRVESEAITRAGLLRLVYFAFSKERGQLRLNSPELDELISAYAVIGNDKQCLDDLFLSVCSQLYSAFHDHKTTRVSQAQFKQITAKSSEFLALSKDIASRASTVLNKFKAIDKEIHQTHIPLNLMGNYNDIQHQMASLCYLGFLSQTPPDKFRRLMVYLKGIQVRLDRLHHNPQKDRAHLIAFQRSVNGSESFWVKEELRLKYFETGLKYIL